MHLHHFWVERIGCLNLSLKLAFLHGFTGSSDRNMVKSNGVFPDILLELKLACELVRNYNTINHLRKLRSPTSNFHKKKETTDNFGKTSTNLGISITNKFR